MPTYSVEPSIIDASLEELLHIAEFLIEHGEDQNEPITILIGGWAVHSYNPWYGSIDIDLITNSKTRGSLNDFLVNERKFERRRRADDTKMVCKPIRKYNIIIDFGTRDQEDRFEGKECYLDYSLCDGQTEVRRINNKVDFPVPKRTLLLLFKLKAAWDRKYRVNHNKSHDIEWERGKITKDFADILALIDSNQISETIDVNYLGEQIQKYPFLSGCLSEISKDKDAINFYGKISDKDARSKIETILELIS